MVASDPQLSPGTIVLGEVRVESVLSVSGLGALHRGRSTGSDVPLLVRVMASEALKEAKDAFAREVLVVRHVEHEAIVAPLDAGVEDKHAIVAYEPVNGPVLHTLLGKSIPLSEVARIASELAVILDHAHRQPAPLIHASLSSSSIVLAGAARSVRLLDLGIVQALERVGVTNEAMWDLLDPAAAAPEQVSRTFPISPATDVFGLASIAYECLTGRPAFPATNAAEAEALIVAGKRPSARDVRRELHLDVDRLLAKAWSVDPRSRPHDIIAFASSLAAALLRPPGALAESVEALLDFEEDDEAETVNLPGSVLTDDPTVRGAIPRVQRAHTLPFGLPKPAPPSDPPPPADRVTVPKIIMAKEPEPEPPRDTPIVPHAAPSEVDPDVRTVRVVSVTGLFVALLFAGAVIIAGAFVAAGSIVAQRTPPPPPKVVAPFATPTPTPIAAPPAPSPSVSVSPSAEPSAEPVATSTVWPELEKEPGPRPTPKALETMRQKLKVLFEPCLKIPPKPPQGIPWMVHFEFDAASGQPVLVEVSRPFRGTLGGACMMRAALDARVPPFDGTRWAIDLRFGP